MILKKKLQLIHTFSMEFSNVMSYVKNLESFYDLYEDYKKS